MRKPSPGSWWSLGGAEAIEVGQVAVGVSDANLGRATAAFTVPELPPGTYHLMLCETACTEPLADVIPAKGFTVVADPATAQIANRVDRLERRSRNQAGRLAAARAYDDKALVAARNARSDVKQLKASVSSLANEGRSAPLASLDVRLQHQPHPPHEQGSSRGSSRSPRAARTRSSKRSRRSWRS
jgi:hypothetical protein